MIADHLRIQPGQEALTPEQEAEARRFAQERIEAQLSTEPVDEPEAEQFLRQAYVVAGFPPPGHIRWRDRYQAISHAPIENGQSVIPSDRAAFSPKAALAALSHVRRITVRRCPLRD